MSIIQIDMQEYHRLKEEETSSLLAAKLARKKAILDTIERARNFKDIDLLADVLETIIKLDN